MTATVEARKIEMWKREYNLSTQEAFEFELNRVESGMSMADAHRELEEKRRARLEKEMEKDMLRLARLFGC